jgi:membrane protease YdiL (CAAX protease family)
VPDAPRPLSPKPGELFRLAAWVYLVMAVGGVAWIGWQRKTIPLALFVDRERWWLDLLAGAGAAVALLLAWGVTRRFVALARGLEERLRGTLGQIETHEAVGLAILSGLGEEVFFRGAMQPAWGYAITTVLFGVLHSGRGREMVLWSASALLAGAVLGGLMEWRGNLLAPVVCHALVNAVQLRRILGVRARR